MRAPVTNLEEARRAWPNEPSFVLLRIDDEKFWVPAGHKIFMMAGHVIEIMEIASVSLESYTSLCEGY